MDDDTTELLVGDSSCVIQTVSLNAVTCITASHAPGLFDVIVVSNSKRYPPQLFNYSSSETPTISSVSPVQGVCLVEAVSYKLLHYLYKDLCSLISLCAVFFLSDRR